MLAIADKNGEVQASIPGLARVAGVSLPDCEAAILKLISPDPYSRTPDDEGRRIEKIDGGWALLNHAKYRTMASKDEAITANAERQRRHRERKKRNVSVTESNGECEIVTQDRDIAEAKADTEAKAKKSHTRKKEESLPLPFDSPEFAEAWGRWTQHRKQIKKPLTALSVQGTLKKFAEWGERQSIENIEASITAGWQGVFPAKGEKGSSPQFKFKGIQEDIPLPL